MTSEELGALGLSAWENFCPGNKVWLMGRVSNSFGVYVIRRNVVFQRTRGASDIVYVGSATNKRGLKGRISQYFSPGPTQSTNKRILALVSDSQHHQIAWVETETKARAVALEQELIDRYVTDHGQRPPENLKG